MAMAVYRPRSGAKPGAVSRFWRKYGIGYLFALPGIALYALFML